MTDFNIAGKKGLAIAEKPNLQKIVKDVFDRHAAEIPYSLDFVAQRGHLLSLLKPQEVNESFKQWSWDNLPITSKSLGGWHYEVTQEVKQGNFLTSQERYDAIEKAIHSGKYDFIVHIGDPDREGQLLIDLVLEKIGNQLPVYRYWENALTDVKVLSALKNLKPNDSEFFQNILKAGKARQHADYLFGMNLSRAATLKMGSRVSVGRVKTVLLGAVCERELEIQNFKPETTFGVQANYSLGFKGTYFVSKDNNSSDDEDDDDSENELDRGVVWFKTEKEAKEFISSTSKKGIVTDYEAKQKEVLPPKFYKLATIQKEAGDKFGYKADKTLSILQSLYEAKLTTYPRSTCEYISSTENLTTPLNAVSRIPSLSEHTKANVDFIKNVGINRMRSAKKWINDKVVDNSGHTAIIPTSEIANFANLTVEQKNIYEMVAKRYLAAFLPPMIQNVVKVIVTVDGNKEFKSQGKTLVSLGYNSLFGRNVNDIELPPMSKGDEIEITNFETPTKTTQCPKRYTSAMLISYCENPTRHLEDETIKKELPKLKIGTPSTLAGIIEDVVRRDKYATWIKEGNQEVMKPNDVGMEIYENFKSIDFSLLKVDTTGRWEIDLERMVEGSIQYEDFEDQIESSVARMIEEIKQGQMTTVVQADSRLVVSECHKCGGDIYQVEKAFYCSNYKTNGCMSGGYRNCGGHIITAEEFKVLQTGETILVDAIFEEKDDKGKVVSRRKYKQRIGLNEKGTIEAIKNFQKETEFTCPACGNKIIETDNAYICKGRADNSCGVYVGKNTSGVDLAKEDIALILSGKDSSLIKKLMPIKKDGKKGQPYDAILYIDKETRKLAKKFPTKETDISCPVCSKKLRDSGSRLICSGSDDHSCQFQMFSTMYKKPITKEKLDKMLDQARSGEISGGEQAFITNGDVDTDLSCPFCVSKIIRNGMQFKCSSCDFSCYRVIGDELLTDEEMHNLFEAGKTHVHTGLISQKGTPYSARQVLDHDKQKVETEFVQEEVATQYQCPFCKNKVVQEGVVMKCSSCDFKFWTKQLGVRLTKNDIDDLFTKDVTRVLRFNKKDGNGTFDAMISIDYEKRSTKFLFPKR